MRRKFWPLIPVTTMQPARECHVTSLHRIRAVFTFESVDAGFADWRSAHFGQPPAPPAGSVLLFPAPPCPAKVSQRGAARPRRRSGDPGSRHPPKADIA